MEFHISRAAREGLDLDDLLFSYSGNVVFGNVAASRKLAERLNLAREAGADPAGADPAGAVNAGALFAMGLIDELSHALVARYRKEIDPAVLTEALRWFTAHAEAGQIERLLQRFTSQFPNVAVYRGETTVQEWLNGAAEGLPNREAALEELLLLWVANINPAFKPFQILFEDKGLKQETVYPAVTAGFPDYFSTRPPVDPEIGSLYDALRAPSLASPDSLTGQLEFIREKWSPYLGEELRRILLAIDVLREEDLAIWMRFHPPGPDQFRHGVPGFGGEGFEGDEFVGYDGFRRPRRYADDYQAPLDEYEAFSADQAWMPNVVLIAKSTYVWLEQLSKKYRRHIHRLDQIPDEELHLLATRGITGLWLIGLWERSTASQKIKRLRGHHDAVASAYSLKSYDIAEDLGGWVAYNTLKHRAAAAGLRLASDMVPNHMGIDSDWVIENPDWFLHRWESPFPSYRFDGPDLSSDSRVEIKIEDHYYEQTDAAVVFRLRHHSNGATRFVYHGNDGTTFAWNDTAQLDYSKAYVREHVIQTILHVARLFPIIRFDAAMVLAKRHVQRLWFPLPGAGGSIPSRAENAVSQEEFDALMPHEFWREVVDRVAAEVPGTLLLAEAFWLLEGYFVRTLGMHRVYNSAFMNMLRDEENAKYRSYLKKTIEWDPDVLKRYVNFMSNPDERTAVDQFGDGDKYFGTCTLLATLPGLPMFGHGQVEGFTERYGMEFKQAKMDEWPNQHLVDRHQREIAPLLKKRHIFAGSSEFTLYDFWTGYGTVNENVFAYSNRCGQERSLVLYNNKFEATQGTIHISASSMDKGSGALRQRSVADGLGLTAGEGLVVACRDGHGREYLRRAGDIQQHGLSFELRGFQCLVLLEWRELWSTAEYPWDRLCDELHGAPVADLDYEMKRLQLRPLHQALRAAIDAEAADAMAALVEQRGRPSPIHADRDSASGASSRNGEGPGSAPSAPSEPVSSQPVALEPVALETVALEPVAHEPVEDEPVEDEAPLPHDRLVRAASAFAEELAAHAPASGSGYTAPGHTATLKAIPRTDPTSPASLDQTFLATTALPDLARRFTGVPPVFPAQHAPDWQRRQAWAPVLAWMLLRPMAGRTARPQQTAPELFDRLVLRSAIADHFASLGLDGEARWQPAARVRLLLTPAALAPNAVRTRELWADPDARWLAGVHLSSGTLYFNKERFEELVAWLQLPALLAIAENAPDAPNLRAVEEAALAAYAAASAAGYQLEAYLATPLPPNPDAEPASKETSAKPVGVAG